MATALKGRRGVSPEKRKADILSAARDVLIERGYSEVLLDEVAERAGVAKGTLYLYFKDKQHLYAAVMESVLLGLNARVEAALWDGTGLERLDRVVRCSLAYIDENQDFFMACGQVRSEEAGRRGGETLRQLFSRHLSLLSGLARDLMAEGSLRRTDDVTAGLGLISLYRMCLMRKVYHGRRAPLLSSAPEVVDLFLNGFGADKR